MIVFDFSVFNDLEHSVNIPKKNNGTFAYEQFPLTYDCITVVQIMFTTFRKLETETNN